MACTELSHHPCRRLEICHKYPEHATHRHNSEQPPFADIHCFRDKSCAHDMSKRGLATVRSKIRRTTSRPTQSVDHSSEIRRRTRTVHQIAAIGKHVAATVHQKICEQRISEQYIASVRPKVVAHRMPFHRNSLSTNANSQPLARNSTAEPRVTLS